MAETPVAGQSKRTGLRRGQRAASPNRDLGSLGLGARTSVQARPVSLLVPNIQVQESPLKDVAKKLGFASEQLTKMQDANAKRYQSEAQQLAQKTVDAERAKGLSLQEIQENFQNGQYPELRSQLQLDTFNAVYGETAADNYFNNPNGEGYKANEEWNKKFLEAPYEERINMNYEQFLAQQHNSFRNAYGSTNVRLLAGGSKGIAIWKEKRRKEFAENYERRLDEDRIQAVTTSIRNDLSASGVDELDPQGVSSDYKVSNSPFLVEASLQNMAKRLDLTGPEKKRAKLAIIENLITDAALQRDPQDQKNNLLIAEKILTTKIPGPVQSLVNDESTFAKLGGGAADRTSTRVKDRALQLLTKINEDLGNIGKDQNIAAIKSEVFKAMASGDGHPMFDMQQTSNVGGTGKSMQYFVDSAIDMKRAQLRGERDHNGQPLSKIETNLRLMQFTERLSSNYVSSGVNQFKGVAAGVADVYSNFFENPEKIDKKEITEFMDAYALYRALSKYSPDRVNKIFPKGKAARNLMEIFDGEARYGTSVGQGGDRRPTLQQEVLESVEEDFQPSGIKEAIASSIRLTTDQMKIPVKEGKEFNTLVEEIQGEIKDDIISNNKFLGLPDDSTVPEGMKNIVEYDIRKFITHKLRLGINPEVIRKHAEEYLEGSLVAIDLKGSESVIFTPPNSPFRTDLESAAKYARDRVVAFAKRAGMEDQADELTFIPVYGLGHDTDKYIIVDKQSMRPVVLDNPNATVGSSVFQVNRKNVQQFMTNYTIGESRK